MSLLQVERGENDLIYTDDGRAFIDLISSTGAVFLGHANRSINERVCEQLDRISCSWTSTMTVQDDCKERVRAHLGTGYHLHSLYSSGMEAAEVAMRIAFQETKRSVVVGFRHNNHGKSVATQNLTGRDPDVPQLEGFHQLPFLPQCSEDDILTIFEGTVASDDVAAVFLEPMQGKGGGYSASKAFYRDLQRLCAEHGVLVICDEIFTGFYRTGPCLRSTELEIVPDIILIGKAIGNGFPAAGVVLDDRMDYHPKDFRLSSTFSDNPLACAAVIGTLAEMERIDVEARVAGIERSFEKLAVGPDAQLRLHGAACFLDLDSPEAASRVHDHLHQRNVLALQRGKILGFWPPATITDEHLEHVVGTTNEALASLR